MNRRLYIIISVVLLVGFSGLLLHSIRSYQRAAAVPQPADHLTVSQYAAERTKLLNLMRASGAATSFGALRADSTQNPSVARDCHPLLHSVGYAAYQQYGSFTAALRVGNEMCNSGYLHGVIEASFEQASDITQAVRTTCPTSPAETFSQWECYHGVGHGSMLVRHKNMAASLRDCNLLDTTFAVAACKNGVFMEHFIVVDHLGMMTAVHADSSAQTMPIADITSCRSLLTAEKPDCYGYAPSAYLEIHPNQYQAAATWCRASAATNVMDCIRGVGSQAMKDNSTRPAVSAAICAKLKPSERPVCGAGAVTMYAFLQASSQAAEPLCTAEFKAYTSGCQQLVTDLGRSLNF